MSDTFVEKAMELAFKWAHAAYLKRNGESFDCIDTCRAALRSHLSSHTAVQEDPAPTYRQALLFILAIEDRFGLQKAQGIARECIAAVDRRAASLAQPVPEGVPVAAWQSRTYSEQREVRWSDWLTVPKSMEKMVREMAEESPDICEVRPLYTAPPSSVLRPEQGDKS